MSNTQHSIVCQSLDHLIAVCAALTGRGCNFRALTETLTVYITGV